MLKKKKCFMYTLAVNPPQPLQHTVYCNTLLPFLQPLFFNAVLYMLCVCVDGVCECVCTY